MCQEGIRRLCNPSENCHVRKVARLLAQPLSLALGHNGAIDRLIENLAYRNGPELFDYFAEGGVERFYLGSGPPRLLYGTSTVNRVRCHKHTP